MHVPPSLNTGLLRCCGRRCRAEDLKRQCERYGKTRDIYMPKDYYTQVKTANPHNNGPREGRCRECAQQTVALSPAAGTQIASLYTPDCARADAPACAMDGAGAPRLRFRRVLG